MSYSPVVIEQTPREDVLPLEEGDVNAPEPAEASSQNEPPDPEAS